MYVWNNNFNFGTQLKAIKLNNNNTYKNHKTALYSPAVHCTNVPLNIKNAQLMIFFYYYPAIQEKAIEIDTIINLLIITNKQQF